MQSKKKALIELKRFYLSMLSVFIVNFIYKSLKYLRVQNGKLNRHKIKSLCLSRNERIYEKPKLMGLVLSDIRSADGEDNIL